METETFKINIIRLYRIMINILTTVEQREFQCHYQFRMNRIDGTANLTFYVLDGKEMIFPITFNLQVSGQIDRNNVEAVVSTISDEYLNIWRCMSEYCLQYPYIAKLFQLIEDCYIQKIDVLDEYLCKELEMITVSYGIQLKSIDEQHQIDTIKIKTFN